MSSHSHSAPAPAESTVVAAASLQVIHQHQFGSCTGALTVSRDGLTFTPESRGKDAFAFAHGEFVQSLSDDTLTVKSADKTYRFKAAAGKDDGARLIRAFVDSIARFRPTPAGF